MSLVRVHRRGSSRNGPGDRAGRATLGHGQRCGWVAWFGDTGSALAHPTRRGQRHWDWLAGIGDLYWHAGQQRAAGQNREVV